MHICIQIFTFVIRLYACTCIEQTDICESYICKMTDGPFIMHNLQNMYNDGDEEMKRTIAKAWTDARSGKTADPLRGFN